jgi:hypothetical protein
VNCARLSATICVFSSSLSHDDVPFRRHRQQEFSATLIALPASTSKPFREWEPTSAQLNSLGPLGPHSGNFGKHAQTEPVLHVARQGTITVQFQHIGVALLAYRGKPHPDRRHGPE